MANEKNYAELKFVDPALIDLLVPYAGNSLLAQFISTEGQFTLRFGVTSPVEPPKDAAGVLSLLLTLMQEDGDSPLGKVYAANETAILRDTVRSLSTLIAGFGDVKITLQTTEPDPNDPEGEVSRLTTFTMKNTVTQQ